MSAKRKLVFAIPLSLGLALTSLWAQAPQLLNYQGKLSMGGTPAADTFSMVFSIYSSATGTTALWSETQSVVVANGIFNVLLGSATPIPNSVFTGSGERYLGIKVRVDPEMTPRFRLASVPFAMRASEADGVADGAITNADVSATAAIAGTKISPNFGSQIITTTGGVGIGTASPGKKFDLRGNSVLADVDVSANNYYGAAEDQNIVAYTRNNSALAAFNTLGDGFTNSVVEIGAVKGSASDYWLLRAFHGNGTGTAFLTQVFGIRGDGNVGIRTASPQRALHVEGTSLINAENTGPVEGLEIRGTSGSFGPSIGLNNGSQKWNIISWADNSLKFVKSTGTTFTPFTIANNSFKDALVLAANGVGIGEPAPSNILTVQQNSATDPIADAWTTYSSRRWKTNIQPISGALEKVRRLRGVTYDWKADGKHDIGLIAEEVGDVIPEVVAYEENGADAKSVDYARLVAVLIEAVKEQQKQIDRQQTTIAALSKRLEVFETVAIKTKPE